MLTVLLGMGTASAEKICGEIKNTFGPFDYRKAASLPEQYFLVVSTHFTSDVEHNIKGHSTDYLAGDIDYTLRAWPNHPAALASMSRQGIIEKSLQPRGAKWPVDCYFLRAFEFAPDDGTPHAVFANHLYAHGKNEEALREFKRAVELEPENPTINYNAGLAYVRTKEYDKALYHAKKAYAQNFPLPGLKNKLVEAGKWNDEPLPDPKPSQPAGDDTPSK
ncbi:MAG TPA: tetratricopeptide repeat protein [Telluria sp.]|nr:tetratricopeptide repeat protein [Telluria sp.]